VSTAARPSRLLYTFFEKLNNLLDRLDKQHMMHGSQSDALKWVCGSRKYTYYCSGETLHGL
jgi:hypothetical protein